MSKGDADIEMNFRVGNAAQATAIMRSVYQNQVNSMKSAQKQNDLLTGSMAKAGKAIKSAAMAYAGFSTASMVLSSVTQGLDKFISKTSEIEKAITPLVMLGDNVKRMGSIRSEVVQGAIGMGRSLEEVGRMYADVVGSTGNLSTQERDELVKETKELAKLTGGDMVNAQNMLTKSYQIYGKELANVNQLQNKLMMTQDEGSIEFNEMALRLPELLQTGRFAKMSIDDVLGTVIGATRKSGSIEKTMTGLRNMILIMEEAGKKGVTLSGTYTEKLGQLQEMFATSAPKMQELFGKEVVVHASAVTDAINDVTAAIEKLQAVGGTDDMVRDKLAAKYQDATFRMSENFSLAQGVLDNAPGIMPDLAATSELTKMALDYKHGAAAFAVQSGGTWGWLGEVIGGAMGVMPGNSMAASGRAISASMAEPAHFQALMREENMLKVEAGQSKLDFMDSTATSGTRGSFLYQAGRAKLQEQMQIQPFLMTPDELTAHRKQTGFVPFSETPDGLLMKQAPMPGVFVGPPAPAEAMPYQIPAAKNISDSGEFTSLKDAMKENSESLRKLTDKINFKGSDPPILQPGGAKANYNETL